MLHERRVAMFARAALFALAIVVTGCSKPQTPVQLHEPTITKVVAVATPTPSVDKPEPVVGPIDPAEFAHVVSAGGATLVVLSSSPDHARWAKGAPSIVSKDNPVVARREVDPTLLPKALTRLAGRAMRLVGDSGEVCRGTLGAPFLLSRVEPHFGERQQWEGEEDENGVKGPPLSDERVAEIAWDMVSDGKLLVAELVETNGACQDAQFARAADLPALATTAARRPSAAVTAQALVALRKLPAYDAIEQRYHSSSQTQPSTSWIESQNADVSMHEFSTGKATYLWVSAFGGEACSDFDGRMTVLWKVSGTNAKTLEFEVVHEGESDFSPHMLVQFPGDAAPSFIGRESLLRKDAKVYEVEDLHVPFLDCPC
jgi:hypothetical protein